MFYTRLSRVLILAVFGLFLVLPAAAWAARQPQTHPAPGKAPVYRLAIFPWNLLDQAHLHTNVIFSAMHEVINETGLFDIKFSYYRDKDSRPDMVQKLKRSTKKIWRKKGWFSGREPHMESIVKLAKELGVDAVLMYHAEVVFGDRAQDTLKAFLIDVHDRRIYNVTGYTGDFSLGEGFREIRKMTREVFASFKLDNPTDVIIVKQKQQDQAQQQIVAQQAEAARLAELKRQEEERQRQKEAARLAELKRQEEAARLAELKRQKEERQRQKEAARLAELKRQEEERQRQKEAARLAELKRQEEERQRQKEAARLAELKRQEEAARLAELKRQEEERQRQKEAARLAELKRQEEDRQRQKEAARLAELKRQEEERQRQKEAARLAELKRQEEAARLADLKRQEEERQRQKEAARLAELKRQEEAARLAELKRQKEERQRQEEAARLAELKRQEEERQRQKEAARLAELKRQEEAARLAELKRQEEERQRQEEAARLAELKRQEEAERLAEFKRQEEERRRQEEAARLAELKRQEEIRVAEAEFKKRQEEAERKAARKRQEEWRKQLLARRDKQPPKIVLKSYEIGQTVKMPAATSRLRIAGQVQDPSGVAEVTVNGLVATLDQAGNFATEILLRVGDNPVNVSAIDVHANVSDVQFLIQREAAVVAVDETSDQKHLQTASLRDVAAPTITVTSPSLTRSSRTLVSTSQAMIAGKAADASGIVEVLVNGEMASLDREGNFSKSILLQIGDNPVELTAMDLYANVAKLQFVIERQADNAQLAERMIKEYKVGKYYAMIVGNNNYRHLEKLETAVNDATEVDRILRTKYGFETELLLDATRSDMLSTLSRLRKRMRRRDNLLVYYAGHGVFEEVAQEAYWLPVDAKEDDVANWIISDSITSEMKRNPARHVLIVSDSCYSGTLTRAIEVNLSPQQSREHFLQKMLKRPSRTLMASGGNEPVVDNGTDGHSIFAYTFLRALKEIDEAVFTAEELFYKFVKHSVAGQAEQTPVYSIIRNSGHDGGDFIFVKR